MTNDIQEVLARVGLRARQVMSLHTIHDPAKLRGTFRVELDSGAFVKARRLESEEAAQHHQKLRAALPPAFVPVLARSGAVLIEPWIYGQPLTEAPLTEPLVHKAGRLLAALHATPWVGKSPSFSLQIAELRDTTLTWLTRLMTAGIVKVSVAHALRAILEEGAPKEALHGLVHTDFCGENMLITAEGRLVVVDNEHATLGPLAMDMARAWYRWGLRDQAWDWFRAGYTAGGGNEEAFAHTLFWRIVSVTISADLRFRSGHVRLDIPVKCLESLAQPNGGTVIDE
ncbi:putative Aminoglycoside phosphotransferase family protein [Gammaproteobacteria bacterium]